MFVTKPISETLEKMSMPIPFSGCQIWIGATIPNGYGFFQYKNKRLYAHRAAWLNAYGEIPKNLHVCHKCDIPSCVNPEHLFLGTQADNNSDCIKKGRHANQNKGITHCKNGHPLNGENLRIEVTGFRRCKICRNEWERNYRKKQEKK